MHNFPQPLDISDMHRLIEAVVTLHFVDRFLRNISVHASAAASLRQRHLVLHDLALYRSARNEIHHQKNGHRDADKGRNDQQESADKVTGHEVLSRLFALTAAPAGASSRTHPSNDRRSSRLRASRTNCAKLLSVCCPC